MEHVEIHFIDAPIFKHSLSTKGEDGYQYRKDLSRGDANWEDYDDVVILSFVCPCGCGSLHMLRTAGIPPTWQWDGNREKPTLSPSIQVNSVCRWHGFLKDGVFEGVK